MGEHAIDTDKDCHEDEQTHKRICADPPMDINVAKIVIHPRFQRKHMQMVDDIGLLRLEKSVNFTSKYYGHTHNAPTLITQLNICNSSFPSSYV